MDELRIVRRAYTVGPQGPRGPLGPVGPKGEQGPIGLKGDKGDMGPMGPRGFQGPQGEKGDVGPIGPIGPLGPKGDKGDQGIQGIQGPIGPQGPKGDIGEAFSIFNTYDSVSSMNADKNNVPFNKFVMITSDIEDSDNADLYIRTDSEESGFKFITNLSGALGIQGPKGDKGDKGDPFTYADFTTAQLEALRGPQGIQGEQGPAGKDGADGQDGSDGADGHTPVITASKSNGVTTVYVDGTSVATINDGVDAISPTLATVATSGSYNDLTDKPTIPTTVSSFTNDSQYLSLIPNSNNHTYVDLGLPSGTLWATMNIGASQYYESGDFYTYGKTTPRSSSSSLPYSGMEDPLDISVDAARLSFGGDWRIPTKELFEELVANTTVSTSYIDGDYTYKFTATNGNYIILPRAGQWDNYGHMYYKMYAIYWTSTPYDDSNAYVLTTLDLPSGSMGIPHIEYKNRNLAYAIRPVCNPYLAAVAKSGHYDDLHGKPTIPSNETASSGGTTLSVVTTGEKYTWNNKANIWRGTQVQYDAITTPDDNTIYIITSAS